jgi:hypothetical protein
MVKLLRSCLFILTGIFVYALIIQVHVTAATKIWGGEFGSLLFFIGLYGLLTFPKA